jgi:hypothetical protein
VCAKASPRRPCYTLDRSAFVPCPEKRPGTRQTEICFVRRSFFRDGYLCDQIECRYGLTGCANRRTRLHNVKEQGSQTHLRSNSFVSVDVFGSVLSANSAANSGGADRDRTDDLKLAKLALSQLSYGPGFENGSPRERRLVGPGRLERPTSRLSGVRSNHLSYEPVRESRVRFRCGIRAGASRMPAPDLQSTERKGNEGGGRSYG